MQEISTAKRVKLLFQHAQEHFDMGSDTFGTTLYLQASDLLPEVTHPLDFLELVVVQSNMLADHVMPKLLAER